MKFSLKSLGPLCLLFVPSTYGQKVKKAPAEVAIKDEYIVTFSPIENGQATNAKGQRVYSKAQMTTIAEEYGAQITGSWTEVLSGVAVKATEEIAETLASHPSVKYVEQNAMVYTQSLTIPAVKYVEQNATVYATQSETLSWGLDRVDQRDLPLDNMFTPFHDGAGVRAYVIDSGVRISHNEFEGRAEWGGNFIGDGIDDDCLGHGTHVAGTIAGATYGVGKATEIVAVKVVDCENTSKFSVIIESIDWVAIDAAAHPEKKAVANISLGPTHNQALNDAAGNLHDSGVITVVSAGNDGSNACDQSPASEPRVITVGSTKNTDDRSWFSNYGSCVDIFAPGEDIISAGHTSDSSAVEMSGTSMATPHVAGVASLLLKANVAPEDVKDYLIDTASVDKVGNPGPDSPNKLLFAHEPCEKIGVSIHTDYFPGETSYSIQDNCFDFSTFTRAQGYFDFSDTTYEEELCSNYIGGEYIFTIFDSAGDGICCGFGIGSYEVTLNGEVVASGGAFSGSESTTLGSCPTSTDIPSVSPTASPSATPTVPPSTFPTVPPSTFPTVPPSLSSTVSPSASPIASDCLPGIFNALLQSFFRYTN